MPIVPGGRRHLSVDQLGENRTAIDAGKRLLCPYTIRERQNSYVRKHQ
jgi:hypothetical protein